MNEPVSSHSGAFVSERRVEFCETDAAGIAHFAALICYMEQAEHAFWRHLGISVVQPLESGSHLSWPRVRVECDYRGAAKFEDVLQVHVRLAKLGSKSLTFKFELRRGEDCIAEGQMVTVCCEVKPNHPLASIEIPNELRQKLQAFIDSEPDA
jgi:YbgC/YbaW family acyl-CoA thioester hydrolase